MIMIIFIQFLARANNAAEYKCKACENGYVTKVKSKYIPMYNVHTCILTPSYSIHFYKLQQNILNSIFHFRYYV